MKQTKQSLRVGQTIFFRNPANNLLERARILWIFNDTLALNQFNEWGHAVYITHDQVVNQPVSLRPHFQSTQNLPCSLLNLTPAQSN